MAEKLLLHIQYECSRHKVQLPWDAIAHRLHPGSSGAAVVQHINRLRRELVAEGHLVPPLSNRTAVNADLNIRGYIREDTKGDDCETTRPVGFDERIDDPKFNLPNDLKLQDDFMDSQCSSLPGSDNDGDMQESPTPAPRSVETSGAHLGVFEFPPEAITLTEGLPELQGQSPAQLGYFTYENLVSNTHAAKVLIRAYHVQDHHTLHGSDAGATTLLSEGTSPSHSFDHGPASSEQNTKTQQDTGPSLGDHLNGYRLAWPHPWFYQAGSTPKAPPPSFDIEQQDYFFTPFAISMQPAAYASYLSLEHSILRPHHDGQPVPSGSTTTKSEEQQLGAPQEHSAQIEDMFLSTVSEEEEDNHSDETGAQEA